MQRVRLEKLTVPQISDNFHEFYKTPKVHSHFHKSLPFFLNFSQSNPVRSLPFYFFKPLLILYSRLCQGLSSCLVLKGLHTKPRSSATPLASAVRHITNNPYELSECPRALSAQFCDQLPRLRFPVLTYTLRKHLSTCVLDVPRVLRNTATAETSVLFIHNRAYWREKGGRGDACGGHGEDRSSYTVFVGMRPLGGSRSRGQDNIKKDLQEIGWEVEQKVGLAQDRGKWRTIVIAVLNIRDP